MEQRPLPSIPNIPEASEDDGGRQNVQVYRTQSGREHYHYQPRIYMRPVPQSAPPDRHHPMAFPVSPPVVPGGVPVITPTPGPGPAAATGTGPPSRPSTAASGSTSAGEPSYFTLDPDDLKELKESEEAEEEAAVRERERRAARAANAEAQGSTGVNPAQKSPEEENAENINKEVHLNNSCHEIPLRPTREGSQTRVTPNPNITNESNNTGNCSWP